tara:strand:- start:1164 stop:1271 length:108 start_codon:yes stop_codon:yes gene_type:complete
LADLTDENKYISEVFAIYPKVITAESNKIIRGDFE